MPDLLKMSLLNSMNPPLKFSSFYDAITYHSQCPMCHNPLEINDNRIVSNIKSYDGEKVHQKLTFILGDDSLTIDVDTELIDVKIGQPYNPVYSIGSSTVYNIGRGSTIPSS